MSTTATRLVSLLKPKRRWLQYSLKGLMLLVLVVAVPCAWLHFGRVERLDSLP
ncbi:MAG TPA: hypothetical protein VND64_16240 [Pirellulales bacterium]|nr:hypothetical protein [Pirellulales bacterium]